jgi:hypothetical protein
MNTGLTAVAVILMLAFLNESMIEWIFGGWLKKSVIKYVALVGGIALAFVFNIQMLASLAGVQTAGAAVYADIVLSGLVMGRGSQYVHDFYSKFLKPASQ